MRVPLLALLVIAAVALAGCNVGPLVDRTSRPGSAAHALVSPSAYAKLVVEIDHPAGSAPNAEAINVLKSTLVEVTGRSADAIQIIQEATIPSEPNKKYTYDEIEELEDQHRSRHTGGDTAVLYVVYVAGGQADDTDRSRTLGAAYHGTSLVMFKGNIRAGAQGGILNPLAVEERCIERSVLVHEFGHAAGLVNLGTPMVRPHEDGENRGHSTNKASVMYHAVENTQDLFAFFGGCADIPYHFDADDKADLQALRES